MERPVKSEQEVVIHLTVQKKKKKRLTLFNSILIDTCMYLEEKSIKLYVRKNNTTNHLLKYRE
jgi:hypothetical protein